ncbi:MAG: glycosyltransferase [Thermodesulfobacteriota bacterium]|nr:glycosyltransferase [Thermodesulfobacteriota bacterium]
MMKSTSLKADFHVHSMHSKRPSEWILKKIGCSESYTEPLYIYRIAKNHGMTHVTITDHNAIDGALEIAHLPDTFISEEVTSYFPDNGCKAHILAINITEEQHREIQKYRANIFDLTAYMAKEGILNIIAHPLYAINDRLTLAHFEQMLLLFKNFELNGARNSRENQCLRKALNALTPKNIERMADKYNMEPLHERPWEKNFFGGSDDHSSLNIARTYTEIEGIETPEQLTPDVNGCRLKVVNHPATPQTMAMNLYSIAYQFYCSKFDLQRHTNKDILLRFLEQSLRPDINNTQGLFTKIYLIWNHRRAKKAKLSVSDSLIALLRRETEKIISDDADFFASCSPDANDFKKQEQKWFNFVTRASNRVMLHFGNHFLDNLSGANVFNIFHTIGSAGGLYTLMAPYFVSFLQFSKDRSLTSQIIRRYIGTPAGTSDRSADPQHKDRVNVAHFTDTFYEVNGVARTLQQHVKLALKNKKNLTVVTCHDPVCTEQAGVKNFKPIGVHTLPEYPELKIFFPPLLEMINYCYEKGFNHIHTATPGPIGLAALAAAKILKLPISGTYHTAIPQYAHILTGDQGIEDIAWKYILWYYDQLDIIYAPSVSTRDELVQKGINTDKIVVYPRGIDIKRFHPEKKNGLLDKLFSIKNGLKLIYTGRVSKEKNLHLLENAFRRLAGLVPGLNLIVVGDGPYLEQMKAATKDLPCYFTGYLKGETLAEVYASANLFVFPSATDTFGNVVLEAQASGLPVIVTDKGGPFENMLPGETGLVVKAGDANSLFSAMKTLVKDPIRLRQMGQAARRYMEHRSFESAFIHTWQMYNQNHQKIVHPITQVA